MQRILLKGSDKDVINAEEIQLKNRLEKIDKDLDSLMQTLLILTGEPPQLIANKMKLLEAEATDIQEKLKASKNKIAKINNSFRDEVTDRWLSLTNNLTGLGNEERLELRQLVKDTFKTITLQVENEAGQESVGLDSLLDSQLVGVRTQNYFDLTLEFHNEKKRLLRLDKHTGVLLAGFDLR